MSLPPNDAIRALSPEQLDQLIDSWVDPAAPPLSRHLELEIRAVHRRSYVPPAGSPLITELLRGWSPGEPSTEAMRGYLARGGLAALVPGAPVPCCGCETCTGIPADSLTRKRRRPRRDLRRALHVDRARAVSVLEVARRLGLGGPVRRGRELVVRCPLHSDAHPSLRIAPDGRRWFCDPCGEGGDAIQLWMRARGLSFAAAVRELTA